MAQLLYSLFFLLLVLALYNVTAVDRSKFRTCELTSFCSRLRGKVNANIYKLLPDTGKVHASGSSYTADLQHNGPNAQLFTLEIAFYTTGVPRVRIFEKTPLVRRADYSHDILLENLAPLPISQLTSVDTIAEYMLDAKYASMDKYVVLVSKADDATCKQEGVESVHKVAVVIAKDTCRISLVVNGEIVVTLNDRNMFQFEYSRKKKASATPAVTDEAAVDVAAKLVQGNK